MTELSGYVLSPPLRDGDFTLYRGSCNGMAPILLVAAEDASPWSLKRLEHEYALKAELDVAWAARPVALSRYNDRTALVLEDPGGEPLDRLLGRPLEISEFLRTAIPLASALRCVHERGLVHKDIKPANVLVDVASGGVWLTGFGIASRLPRERQSPEPPEVIAGTLAYMAPEQTGRMNRSIDSRSDLYSLGVTLYQMLTGTLPFTASDPMEWVHCHIARRPAPPGERIKTIPAPVSRILMKLLAKAAEDRYQSAAGLGSDLRRCLAAWEAERRIDDFPLGEHDAPDRLFIPEKLYGRERELEILLASFDRIVKGGAPELVLVSGYSGIGKSSVVNELHKALVPPRGLFASGKFDQYKRDIPYSTLVQAFQSLMRPLLGKSDAELAIWRGAFLEALDPNARLMTDLIPELKLIIGDQPPVPELAPQQAQNRFQLVFRRLIGVFARPEHPLALFLDDLQWLDAATLDLLDDLLTRSDMQHLMLIGAYRDNEVDAAHPLAHKIEAMKNARGKIEAITLAPLTPEHLGDLIADALRRESERAAPLARLVHQKTSGNPFFVIQFLYALAEERLLRFDHDAACWSWDLDRIHAKRYTDNVVDLMVGKLNRLPTETQNALQHLACLGNVAATAMLSTVLDTAEEQAHATLWPAVRQELVERLEGSYKFVHDRVQEAAYSLIPEALRAVAHLRIGRLLAAQTSPEKLEEAIFDIVNQLNRGAALVTQQDERDQLAELNLMAGKRAKASTAYASALAYLIAGSTLLAEELWERRRELIFALELNRAECEFLTGQLSTADERLAALSNRATTTIELAIVACLHIDVCMTLYQSSRAVAVCLNYLRHIGIEWSPHPKEEEVRREYERIWSLLGGRTIEELIDLPLMQDPASLATVDVLSKVAPTAFHTDANLAVLTICKAVSLSLERGNCGASCYAYVIFGRIAGPSFDDYKAGFRFGQLGFDLVERRGLRHLEARTYHCFANFVLPWMKHVQACGDLMRRAFEAANRIGDLTYAAYTRNHLNSALLFAGEQLLEVQGVAEHGLAFAEKARFSLVIDFITPQLALTRMLRGLALKFGCFDDGQFDELRIEHRLSSNSVLAIAACWYWIRKLQARYIAGDYATAMDAASKAQRLLWTSIRYFEEAEYHFYGALVQAVYCDSAPAGQRQQHLDALAAHHKKLQVWAEHCPENFEIRAALVGAEIARIEGREPDAMRLYEQAIRSARTNGFIHNEALANELAARFYAARGFEQIAQLYLRNARHCYLCWGASGKVRQLDRIYPHLQEKEPVSSATGSIEAPVEHFDLTTVLKVSQAVSGEIVLEKLIELLLTISLEHAGAERGLLILLRCDKPQIVAEATTGHGSVEVTVREVAVTPSDLPGSMLQYVIRTRNSVVLDDALVSNLYSEDEHVRQKRPRSVLCLPIVRQAELVGVLYLENNLTPHAFPSSRVKVLELLSAQAAISLENATLYSDLQRENTDRKRAEQELRQSEAYLAEAQRLSQTGSFGWNVSSGEIFWSDETFRVFGYDKAVSVTLNMVLQRIHPEDLALVRRTIDRASSGRKDIDYEHRLLMPDDSVKHVHVVARAISDEPGNIGFVGAVMDVTVAKLAEEELQEAQTELAHATRLTALGELTASIAHEVNQPLAGVVSSGNAALRWLNSQPPSIENAKLSVEHVTKAGKRAAEVIQRIRALSQKTVVQKAPLDINDVIEDVMPLVRHELLVHSVSLRLELAAALPPVVGDRIQLQQVIVNLLMNSIQAMRSVTDRPRELLTRSREHGTNQVLVAVEDSGTGIESQNVDRLFNAFFTTKPDGMGIGLSICRSIIEQHGGRIWATRNSGVGSTFQFTLDTRREMASPPAPKSGRVSPD